MKRAWDVLKPWLVFLVLFLGPSATLAQRTEVKPKAVAERLDLTPFPDAPRASSFAPELGLVLAGDRLLLDTTVRLFAFDAGTTALAWTAGPPVSWEKASVARRQEWISAIDW